MLGHVVHHQSRVPGQQDATATAEGRVGVRRVDFTRDKVFVLNLSNGRAVGLEVSGEMVPAPVHVLQAFQILHHVLRVGEHVVVAIQQERRVRAVFLLPIHEEHLLQSEVVVRVFKVPLDDVVVLLLLQLQEFVQSDLLESLPCGSRDEQPADVNAVHFPLRRPSFAQHLSAFVVVGRAFDDQQEENWIGATFARGVEQQGEVATVSVVEEFFQVGGKRVKVWHAGDGGVPPTRFARVRGLIALGFRRARLDDASAVRWICAELDECQQQTRSHQQQKSQLDGEFHRGNSSVGK